MQPALAACTALSTGIVPLARFDSAGSATVFTQSTSTATALVQGALAYDTTANALNVCDGSAWVALSTGAGASSSGTAGYVQISGGSGAFTSDASSLS